MTHSVAPAETPSPATPPPIDEATLLQMQLKIWNTAIKTQMHFNDMSAKARQHGISLVVVIVGFALFLLTRSNADYFIPLFGRCIHISVFITALSPIVLYAVKRLDLGIYHHMLRGAVTFGENFEEAVIRKRIMTTHQGMTQLISIYSRHKSVNEAELSVKDDPKLNGKKYVGDCKKSAGEKLNFIYNVAIGCLIALPCLLLFIGSQLDQNHCSTLKQKASVYEQQNSTSNM